MTPQHASRTERVHGDLVVCAICREPVTHQGGPCTEAVAVSHWHLTVRASQSGGGRRCAYLRGLVESGETVKTSALIGVSGRIVSTRTGSRYQLVGAPHPDFAPELGSYPWDRPLDLAPGLLGFAWHS